MEYGAGAGPSRDRRVEKTFTLFDPNVQPGKEPSSEFKFKALNEPLGGPFSNEKGPGLAAGALS